MTIFYVALLSLLLACSAFVSAAEVAFLSLRQVGLQRMVRRRVWGARRIARMAEHPERDLLPTTLLVNNLTNIAFASLATSIALALFSGPTSVLVATVATTVVVVFLGEMVPKALGVRHAEAVARVAVYPLVWTERLLLPGVVLLKVVGHLALRVFGGAKTRPPTTEEEVLMMVSVGRAAGTMVHREAQLVENVFRSGDKKARDVMTPRTRAQWVHAGMGIREFLALYHRRPEGRFPVYKESVDNVVGVLATRDVLKAIATGELQGEAAVTSLALPPFFTLETKPLLDLLDEMRASGAQMAIAVDEFGGVAGSVTLAQVLEPLVGPLTREALEGSQSFVSLSDDTVEVNGDLAMDEANEQLGLSLPEGDYMTVAGMVLDHLGHIPTEGETLNVGSVAVRVARMQGRRIARVHFRRVTTTELEGIRPAEDVAP
jgi:putative hemolysin